MRAVVDVFLGEVFVYVLVHAGIVGLGWDVVYVSVMLGRCLFHVSRRGWMMC